MVKHPELKLKNEAANKNWCCGKRWWAVGMLSLCLSSSATTAAGAQEPKIEFRLGRPDLCHIDYRDWKEWRASFESTFLKESSASKALAYMDLLKSQGARGVISEPIGSRRLRVHLVQLICASPTPTGRVEDETKQNRWLFYVVADENGMFPSLHGTEPPVWLRLIQPAENVIFSKKSFDLDLFLSRKEAKVFFERLILTGIDPSTLIDVLESTGADHFIYENKHYTRHVFSKKSQDFIGSV